MIIDNIPAKISEEVFNVVIEISSGDGKVKYEFNEAYGAFCVDRMSKTTMSYPANYGFIPNTLGGDGDPLDILVFSSNPLITGCVVAARAIGVLVMEDEKGMDEKIIAVPGGGADFAYNYVRDLDDLYENSKQRIEHFFTHYKALDKNKWVKIKDWESKDVAYKLINESVERAGKK